MSWLSASKTSLHCCIIGTLGLVVVVIAVVVVLVVGCGLRSVGFGCPILHGRLIPCGCGVVGVDLLCSFLLSSMLYQELASPSPLTHSSSSRLVRFIRVLKSG